MTIPTIIEDHTTLENKLYETALDSLVSEKTSENTFSKMLVVATYTDRAELVATLKKVEQRVKEEYGVTSMPSPWRSAKSVVIQAMSMHIPLEIRNESGGIGFKGKTLLQNDIRAHKTSVAESFLTQDQQANKHLEKILPLLTNMPETMNKGKVLQKVMDVAAELWAIEKKADKK